MKTFQRYSTVAYDARNLSILSIESISSPKQVEIDSTALRLIFSAVLTPTTPNISPTDAEMVNALLSETGWALRVYRYEFEHSTQLPLDLLRGFLLIPLQFSTTAWMWVNSTQQYRNMTDFALPPELETTASPAEIVYRAIAKPWTVGLFIAAVSGLLIWCYCLLAYILVRGTAAPNCSSFVELDVTSKSSHSLKYEQLTDMAHSDNRQGYDLSRLLRKEGLGNSESRAIVEIIRDKNIRLAEVSDDQGNKFLVLLTGSSSPENFVGMEGNIGSLHYGSRYL